MKKLIQVDFPYGGAFGEEMAKELKQLAESIKEEPGFIWKIWTEDSNAGEAGGIYLFESEETAKAYLEMHTARLKSFGIAHVNGKIFDINETLTETTQGPI